MNTETLSPRQQDVLSYLKHYCSENGFSPTMAEIARYFDWSSSNAAHIHIKALAKKGFVTKTPRGYVPA